jgi:hypothetical protein
VSLSLNAKANSHTKMLLTVDMCQSVDAFRAVPLPAVKMALKPDAESPAGGVRLDLDGTVFGRQRPQVTATVAELELQHPTKVAPCFWEERHCPQKIPDRRVTGVQTELNVSALQPEKRHRFVVCRYQTRQNHDLATGWGDAVEEGRSLGLELEELVLWEGERSLHRVPKHPQEREAAHGDNARLLPFDEEPRLHQNGEGPPKVGLSIEEGHAQDQDVVEVENGSYSMTTQLCLDLLCEQSEYARR